MQKYILAAVALCLSAVGAEAMTYHEWFTSSKDAYGRLTYTHSSTRTTTYVNGLAVNKDQTVLHLPGGQIINLPLQTHMNPWEDIQTVTSNYHYTSSSGDGGDDNKLRGVTTGSTFVPDDERNGMTLIYTNLYNGRETATFVRSMTCGRVYFTGWGEVGAWRYASSHTFPCTNPPTYSYNAPIPRQSMWFPDFGNWIDIFDQLKGN